MLLLIRHQTEFHKDLRLALLLTDFKLRTRNTNWFFFNKIKTKQKTNLCGFCQDLVINVLALAALASSYMHGFSSSYWKHGNGFFCQMICLLVWNRLSNNSLLIFWWVKLYFFISLLLSIWTVDGCSSQIKFASVSCIFIFDLKTDNTKQTNKPMVVAQK